MTGQLWFAMDLVLDEAGRPRTLEDVRCAGTVTEEEAAAWFADIREALAYVHGMGVTHRDVKLENVLVDAGGHAVLSDFGVSRILDPDLRLATGFSSTTTFVDRVGQRPVMGTLGYLPPEVKAGLAATPAADLYAFGVLMFRLLTGLWYEPGTDALALLEPFEWNWEIHLAPLLATDPERRTCPLRTLEPRSVPRRLGRLRAVFVLALAVVLAGLVSGVLWWRSCSRVVEDSFEEIFGVPTNYRVWEGTR